VERREAHLAAIRDRAHAFAPRAIRFSQDIVNLGGKVTFGPSPWVGLGGVRVPSVDHYGTTATTAYWAGWGVLELQFKRIGSGCLQAFAGLAHTWDSTVITGFSVGGGSFGIVRRRIRRPRPDGVGRFNHFQHGSVYFTPNTGALARTRSGLNQRS
jgi:LGFP repeat